MELITRTTVITTAAAAALLATGLVAPAAFADETAPAPASSPAAVDYEAPVAPTAEQLAAAGLTASGLTITPGAGSYTVTIDSLSLANGVQAATLSIGDNRSHNGGVNYTDWVDVTAANNGTAYTVTIPADAGEYTVTVSAGYTAADGNPLLGNLAETSVPVAAK